MKLWHPFALFSMFVFKFSLTLATRNMIEMAFLVTFVDRPGLPRTICMMFMRATASIGFHASSLFALFFRILERLPDGLSFENVHVKTLGKNLSRVFFNFQL